VPVSAHTARAISIAMTAALLVVGLVALTVLLQREARPQLDKVRERGTLIVSSRSTAAVGETEHVGRDAFELSLVRQFADYLGVDLRVVGRDSLRSLLGDVATGSVDMAAAGLGVTPARAARFAFSLPYLQVHEQLVYRAGSYRPRTLDDIAPGDLHVVADSSHEETLAQLRDDGHPDLGWRRHALRDARPLLRQVDSGEIRLTVADSHTVAKARRIYRHVAVALDLNEDRPVAWAFRHGDDRSLLDAANRFLDQMHADGRLAQLQARYFGHTGRLNFVDTRAFWRGVRDRLPTYRPLFEQAATETGHDWRLLAAISYQESHWDPDAVSPTGVRGLMMLTQVTAKRVGVSNRLDPEESILGGARYLQLIERRIPERISGQNRIWLTLAGYNVGFGHLEDARVLTERQGGNPDLWLDIKQHLPLLADPAHYKTLRYGFARGQEPVDYVENIRNFYDMMIWFTTTRDQATVERLLAD
jgi:membrane-bound lytic murein transglycosylase F